MKETWIKGLRSVGAGLKNIKQKGQALLLRIRRWHWRRRGGVYYVNGSEVLPAPLSREEEAEMILRLATDEYARQTLIEHNLRLVVYIAKRFENTGAGLEDLVSIGTIGLIKAVKTFDADKKIKMATYASRCIENEILMFLRKNADKWHSIAAGR